MVAPQQKTALGQCRPCRLKVWLTFLQDPLRVCRILFRQLVGREPDGYAAEAAGLPDLMVSVATALP